MTSASSRAPGRGPPAARRGKRARGERVSKKEAPSCWKRLPHPRANRSRSLDPPSHRWRATRCHHCPPWRGRHPKPMQRPQGGEWSQPRRRRRRRRPPHRRFDRVRALLAVAAPACTASSARGHLGGVGARLSLDGVGVRHRLGRPRRCICPNRQHPLTYYRAWCVGGSGLRDS